MDAADDIGAPGSSASAEASNSVPDNLNPALVRLRRAYVNEKCSPELLPFAVDFQELAESLKAQQAAVESMSLAAGSVAPRVYQQDIDRVRYLLAAYSRTRLKKIEAQHFFLWYDAEAKTRLSVEEATFLADFVGIRAGHHTDSVIAHLPQRSQQDMDDDLAAVAASMRPSLSTHVFARMLDTVEGATAAERPLEEPIDLTRGHDVLVQYAFAREAVLDGRAQLH